MTTGQPDCPEFPAFNPSSYGGLAYHTIAGNVFYFNSFLHGIIKAANRCKLLSRLFSGTQTPYLNTEVLQIPLLAESIVHLWQMQYFEAFVTLWAFFTA